MQIKEENKRVSILLLLSLLWFTIVSFLIYKTEFLFTYNSDNSIHKLDWTKIRNVSPFITSIFAMIPFLVLWYFRNTDQTKKLKIDSKNIEHASESIESNSFYRAIDYAVKDTPTETIFGLKELGRFLSNPRYRDIVLNLYQEKWTLTLNTIHFESFEGINDLSWAAYPILRTIMDELIKADLIDDDEVIMRLDLYTLMLEDPIEKKRFINSFYDI